MGSRLREGERVHLDGIGYFQVKLNSLEPITSPKLKANQMKLKANIGFKADKKLRSSVSDPLGLSRTLQTYAYHCRPTYQTAERRKEVAEYQYSSESGLCSDAGVLW